MVSEDEANFLVRALGGLRQTKQTPPPSPPPLLQQQKMMSSSGSSRVVGSSSSSRVVGISGSTSSRVPGRNHITDPEGIHVEEDPQRSHREAVFMLQVSQLREQGVDSSTMGRLRLAEERIAELNAQLMRSEEQRSEAVANGVELNEKLQAATNEAARLRERLATLTESTREDRRDLLRRQIVRRMMSQGLASGWANWHALWVARRAALGRLQRVIARLRWPALSSALRCWRSWYLARRVTAERQEAARQKATLELELEKIRAEYEARLVQAEEEKVRALERQRAELIGSSHEQMAILSQQERAARVELVTRQLARRILHRDLALGWQAWQEASAARSAALRWMARAASRMRTPELVWGFRAWRSGWKWERKSAAVRKKEAERYRGDLLLAEKRAEAAAVISRVAERRRLAKARALAMRHAHSEMPHWPPELPLPIRDRLLPLPTGFAQMRWKQQTVQLQALEEAEVHADAVAEAEEHRRRVAAERARIESATRGMLEERRLSGLSPATLRENRVPFITTSPPLV